MKCRPSLTGALIGPILVLILAAIASATGPRVVITDAGYWVLNVDSGGTPVLTPAETIDYREGGEDPPQNPTDPPPEPTEPPEGISADAASWSTEVGDPSAAQRYALILETVKDGIAGGDIPPSETFNVLRDASDKVLTGDWDSFRRKLGDYLTVRLQAGDLVEAKTIANTIELIRYGVAYSAAGAPSLSDAEAVEVIATVNGVIEKL